jgi:hypothetical protein
LRRDSIDGVAIQRLTEALSRKIFSWPPHNTRIHPVSAAFFNPPTMPSPVQNPASFVVEFPTRTTLLLVFSAA